MDSLWNSELCLAFWQLFLCTKASPRFARTIGICSKILFACVHIPVLETVYTAVTYCIYKKFYKSHQKNQAVSTLKSLTWAIFQQKIPDRSPGIWINSRSGLIQDYHFCLTHKSNGNRQFPLHSTYQRTNRARCLR